MEQAPMLTADVAVKDDRIVEIGKVEEKGKKK